MYRIIAWTMIFTCFVLVLPDVHHAQDAESQPGSGRGMLILNELGPWPGDGGVWVELINPTIHAISLSGWSLRFLSGFEYEIPEGFECSGGDTILIIFGNPPEGGLRAEVQNVITETAQIVNPGQTGDGCMLVAPGGVIDIITWGNPPTDIIYPIAPGAPLRPPYDSRPSEGELFNPTDVLIRINPDISGGNLSWVGSDKWVYRSHTQATPASATNIVGPWRMIPSDGARMASDFPLGVTDMAWADQITFQIATDEGFVDVVIEETVQTDTYPIRDLAPGTYYWRVKAWINGIQLRWSDYQIFTIEEYDLEGMVEDFRSRTGTSMRISDTYLAQTKSDEDLFIIDAYELDIPHKFQMKDTHMVCFDGCTMGGTYAWDIEHPYGARVGGHNKHYCGRASCAMIACMFGNQLSEDRISYFIFQELGAGGPTPIPDGHFDDPFCDLGHGYGFTRDETAVALDWIYQQPLGSSEIKYYSDDLFANETAAIDSIVEYIQLGIPLIRSYDDHQTVVDGAIHFLEEGHERRFIRIVNPSFTEDDEAIYWEDYESSEFGAFIFPPQNGIPVKEDEPEVHEDSDNDGLYDFDEINRFGTDPDNEDTDRDGIPDMLDMVGYLFDRLGWYDPKPIDMDNDGAAKESDPDNDDRDNRSSPDGCEDTDHDGFFVDNGTETNNFTAGDDFDVINPDCFSGIIRGDHIMRVPLPDGGSHDQVWYEEIILATGELNSGTFSHLHRFGRMTSLQSTLASGGNEDFGLGGAKVSLLINEELGTYTLVTDVDSMWGNFQYPFNPSGIFAGPNPSSRIITVPSHFGFAGNTEFDLGTPTETADGLLFEGEVNLDIVLGGADLPFVDNVLWWRILVGPSD